MKLRTVHIREYKSIWDSNPIQVDRITCLVGKNESGKTVLLEALYRLNPIIDTEGEFDVTDDYPRSEVENYQWEVERKGRQPAVVVTTTFELEAEELARIRDEYGDDVLAKPVVEVSKGYAKGESGKCQLFVNLPVVQASLVRNLVKSYELPAEIAVKAVNSHDLEQLSNYLEEIATKSAEALARARADTNQLTDEAEKAAALEKTKSLAESEQAKALRSRVAELLKHKNLGIHIWETILKPNFPKFFYFDEYYQMRGHENVQALMKRMADGQLKHSDHPLLGLIALARLDLESLLKTERTQELKNKLQGASNYLSAQILKYWSQNRHLSIQFDVREARPGDPEEMTTGTNIWGEVYDSTHLVSTGLGTRSRGFVWFYSFLAWYSAIKRADEPLVLLLDEPGLSLHGKAQEDLLSYFEAEILPNPNHQLIYTTHSPFMVDSQHFDRVRIVQDKGIDSDKKLPREQDGTKVFTDVLEAEPDSLFPLQGALGYEIHQTLFIGPNNLVVEGVSDLLYIQTISGLLQTKGRIGLESRWTITPVGGADKVPTFVALIGSQKKLIIATLIDFQKSHQQMIENLYKRRLLKKNHVLTFADFTAKMEADIEDMLDENFYIDLINQEYSSSLKKKVKATDLPSHTRIIARLEDYFRINPLKDGIQFNHYRPARFFSEKVSTFTISDVTLDRFEAAFKALNSLLPK